MERANAIHFLLGVGGRENGLKEEGERVPGEGRRSSIVKSSSIGVGRSGVGSWKKGGVG